MQYLGSKSRIAKDIAPIIQSYIQPNMTYVEPFVGGANMIDHIKAYRKVGYDVNPYLIALLRHVKESPSDIPDVISHEEYTAVKNNKDKYPEWYVGLIGFCGSFGSKWFGGYARQHAGDNSGSRSISALKNLKSQAESLKDTDFVCYDYRMLDFHGAVIYCDPPYLGTTGYKNGINAQEFYDWCRKMKAHDNIVLVSEYSMPADFKAIWSKPVTTHISRGNVSKAEEKLYLA